MPWALFFLLLSLGSNTLSALPTRPGDDDQAAAQALLAELAEHIPPRALKGVSCQELRPETLPGFPQLPPLPRALAHAAMVLVLSGAACIPQAEAEMLGLYRELGPSMAGALLRGLARLQGAPAPQPLTLLLVSLVWQQGSAQARLCVSPTQPRGPMASTQRTPAGMPASQPLTEGVRMLPGARRPRAWLPECRRAIQLRSRHRREDEEACKPPGEQEAHSVVEWVPGISIFYNLGTSVYYAFQGCKSLASTRALEAAEDLGYASLAAITGGIGGPVAMGIQMGLQPGLKAGVRALISYFTSDGVPPPAPTTYSGPVLFI
ncbi:APOF protein, partial [Bucco capensis]|nr:APOF protein [Bucco capensis]